jgi:HK97 family phage major capsid protein
MDIDKKNEERIKLVKQAQALAEKENFSKEDEQQFDKLMNGADEIKASIDRHIKLENALSESPRPKAKLAAKSGGAQDDISILSSKEYLKELNNWVRTGHISSDLRSFKNVLSTSPDVSGGFLIGEEWWTEIIKNLELNNVLIPLSKSITTTTLTNFPVRATRAVASYSAENANFSESESTYANETIDAHKMTVLTRVSDELLQDNWYNIESEIQSDIGEAMGLLSEEKMFSGTGTNEPRGILLDAQVINGGAGAITTDHIMDMIYGLKKPYRRMSSFIAHTEIIKAIRNLKDGNGQFIYQPSPVAGIPDTVHGYMVHETENMDSTTTAGDEPLLFGDYKNYFVATRKIMTIKRLEERYAELGQIGFRAYLRHDAKLLRPEGVKKLLLA